MNNEEINTQNENKSLTLIQKKAHRHEYKELGNYLICACGKKVLKLYKTDSDGIYRGVLKNGKGYKVRADRHRYFFPSEWKRFIKTFEHGKPEHYFFFLTALHTGGRAMEILNLKVKNFDFNRQTISFDTIKQRSAKKNFFAIGKSRTFFVSEKYLKEVRKWFIDYNKQPDDYLFIKRDNLPKDYDTMSNKDKKKYYQQKEPAYNQMLKRRLKSLGFLDWEKFSLHNIRKTYGQWMRIYDIKTEEICYRLGHDMATYFLHYGNPLIFGNNEKIEINNILGQVK